MEFMIDENLEQIFSYLNQSALINASLVCRRWSEIIQNSPFLLKPLELIIFVQQNYFKIQSVFPYGKYRNLTMTLDGNVRELPNALVEDFSDQSEFIMNTTLANFDRINSIQALSVLKNITTLVIENYQHENYVLGVIDLPNLRHLELINSIPFSEVIDTQSLTILKIYGEKDTRHRFEDDNYDLNAGLNNFLEKCHNLKDLTLSNIRIKNSNLKSENFNFNLEALTIEDFNFVEENLVEFLIKMKNSLKKLAIFNNLPRSIISIIIFSQLTLDELEIDVKIIPRAFNSQMVNRTIKKLTIRSTIPQDNRSERYHQIGMQFQSARLQIAAIKIKSICNEVEEFMILENIFFDSLQEQLNCKLRNLKILKLETIPSKLVTSTNTFDNFNTLEVIEIDKICTQQDVKNCTSLVIYCPNLKTLKINSMEKDIFTPNFFIEIVKNSKNLREIHIGVSCVFTKDMIEIVRLVKDIGYPLESMSFLFCLIDDKIGHNRTILTFMDELKLNFRQNSNNFFSKMINETKLGRMTREIDDKHKDLEHQRSCGVQRKLQIEKYERKHNL